ncbi:MAG: DUF2141 domain-containing protein [Brevundimonas sp.]|uniref:DUF2141 domain-containing protein n=1 Tax=Brevundimonas sp. TaxID=1871086 RepID=UPI00181749D7|nr:DUF2141 domain-containing protein [Brevundimonas sp.]MBA4803766.1 DUF2141 domain-containing protein [Brevundimonas sp.]
MIRIVCAAAAALTLFAPPAVARNGGHAATLTFETGASSGRVLVALYDSEAAWRAGRPVARAALDATAPVVAVFRDLPAGDYAVKAFHDIDGDGEMDVNPFGMPVEPYAFSNNAVGNMGPAGWDQARFAVSGDVAQTIRIR